MTARARADAFCQRFGLRVPILLAPMAGACPPALAAAVANAGGLGACGALMMDAPAIARFAAEFRAASNGGLQINLWVPEPEPSRRDAAQEARVRAFLAHWGPAVPEGDGEVTLQDFRSQCAAALAAAPAVVSSIMGIYPADFVARLKQANIAWFATATTLSEALAATAAGADAIIAQGMEAGGHRGAFEQEAAERRQVGLFALLPAIADQVNVPVIAAGGIADGRGVAAALTLGASAVLVGTAFLRSPEANILPAWADAVGRTAPEDTMLTRAYSGRAGRSIATDYVKAAAAAGAFAAYPVQRGLSAAMKEEGAKRGDVHRVQAWAGQSAALARAEPAGVIAERLWREARTLLA